MTGPVVVGVDGSESSVVAVAAAAREASRRKVPLRVLHAYTPPALQPPLGLPPQQLRETAEQTAADTLAAARAGEPELGVTLVAEPGEPITVLEDESRRADLMVVGNRGRNAFTGLLLGSTSVRLAAHAHCPVMVTRGRSADAGPVVVGVDGSTASEPAVDFAFAEASRRRVPLVVVHAWTTWNTEAPRPEDPAMAYAARPGALRAQEERVLAESIAGRCETYPDVEVERRPVRGETREALIEASDGAELIVVGSRGHGGFVGLLLGSVSQAVLYHAHCSVVVVPGRR